MQVVNGRTVRRGSSLVAMDRFIQSLTSGSPLTVLFERLGGQTSASVAQEVDATLLWDWLKDQLTERPGWVAKMVGIPELASLAHFDLPKAPITVRQVIDEYRRHSVATDKSKREAITQFERLVGFSGARTLDEATSDDTLIRFRTELVNDPELNSTDTVAAYLARIRGVIRIAGRGDLDAVQITRAVERCKAKLDAPPSNVVDDPHPISRDDFHRLLDGRFITDVPEVWAVMLLMGLNAALYMEDLCDLKWKSINLDAKTFVARRKKRGRCRQHARHALQQEHEDQRLQGFSREGGHSARKIQPHSGRRVHGGCPRARCGREVRRTAGNFAIQD